LLGFTIGSPKYHGSRSGLSGSELLPPRFNGRLAKKLFTSLGIFSCKLQNNVSLGVCGLDLTPSIVWTGADTNGASIIVFID
jgi:hypothetical protein